MRVTEGAAVLSVSVCSVSRDACGGPDLAGGDADLLCDGNSTKAFITTGRAARGFATRRHACRDRSARERAREGQERPKNLTTHLTTDEKQTLGNRRFIF